MNAHAYDQELLPLMQRLREDDRYRCIAGVPGPLLELRSGTLPSGVSARAMRRALVALSGLEGKKLACYEKQLAKQYRPARIVREYARVTHDAASRLALLKGYVQGAVHKITRRSLACNKSRLLRYISLTLHGKKVTLAVPDDLVSLGLLWEIFVEEPYYFDEEVDCIYDLGANIGFSAVYFQTLNPSAQVICVEPMAENLKLLEHNLELNRISAQLVRAAVGDVREKKSIYFSEQSHALPSLHHKQMSCRSVEVMPLDEIVDGGKYGLKIDIEGGEASLLGFESIIKNAVFVVGELHYSVDPAKNERIDRFFDVIQRNFSVTTGRSSLYFVGRDVELCKCYRATRRTSRLSKG